MFGVGGRTAGDGGAEDDVSLPSSLAAQQTSAAGCARSRKGRRLRGKYNFIGL